MTGGISQSELCSCREQTCLNIYLKLLNFSVTILRYSPGNDDIVWLSYSVVVMHKAGINAASQEALSVALGAK